MRRGRLLIMSSVTAATLLLGAAAAQAAQISAAREPKPLKYGDIVRLASSTLMVVGRPFAPAQGQADNGNTILYRRGSTLYIVDTGSTVSFRPFLRRAINRLRPFSKVVLFNSHGHPDHIGNNSTVAGIAGTRLRYYMSRRDYAIADHPHPWLLGAVRAVSGYVPGFDDPAAQTHQLLDLFLPLNTLRSQRRAIESLPQRMVRIGQLRTRAWIFGGGAVDVLPTRGHTPGSLSFYFPKIGLLHMADELNSYYPAFPESNPMRIRTVFGLARKAAAAGQVRLLTDGHTYNVIRGVARVRARLQSYIDGYNVFDHVFRRILTTTSGGVTVSEIITRLANAPELADKPGGSKFDPFTGALVVLKKLKQLGAHSSGGPRADQRFSLP
jgi:glyoxylase-like metal-dependent hydrolase (beta-lactamase superfamily II)